MVSYVCTYIDLVLAHKMDVSNCVCVCVYVCMCECVCPAKTSYAPIVPDSYVSYEHRAIKLSDRMKSLAVQLLQS